MENNPLVVALQLERAPDAVANIAQSIHAQESSRGRNTKTSNAGAVGGMQIIPATFNRFADKGWNINNPIDNARAGVRYINHLQNIAGGDPALTAVGYYGGEGAIEKARKGVAVSDPRNSHAPNTLQYGQQVKSHMGAQDGSDVLSFLSSEAAKGASPKKGSSQKVADNSDVLSFLSDEAGKVKAMPANAMSKAAIAKNLGVKIDNHRVQVALDALAARAQGGGAQDVSQAQDTGVLGAINHGIANGLGGVYQGEQTVRDLVGKAVNAAAGRKVMNTNHAAQATKDFKQYNQGYDQSRQNNGQTGIDVGSLAGNVLAAAPTMLVGGQALSGVKLLSGAGAKGLATNASIGAGVGAANYADSGNQRLNNTGAGAVGGAVGAVAGKAIGAVATKVGNIVKNAKVPLVQQITDLADKYGVRVSAGDASRNPLIQKAEVQLENLPIVGTKGFREAQQADVAAAAQKLGSEFETKMQDAGYKGIDALNAAAAKGDKNALRIKAMVDSAGNDASRVLQASGSIQQFRGNKIAKQMYDQVAKEAGNGIVTPSKTLGWLQSTASDLEKSLSPDEALQSHVQKIITNLADPKKPTDFPNMRRLRSEIGDAAQKAGSSGDYALSTKLTSLKGAVESDLQDFAANSGNPNLARAAKRADSFFSSMMKGRDSQIAKALNSNKPDEIMNEFIKVGKGDRAANFYKQLDPKGQAALRYSMVDQAIQKATNPSTGMFSPAKFAGHMESFDTPVSKVFNGADKFEIQGFSKLMRHVARAGQYMENPPNGAQMAQLAAGGAGVAAVMTGKIIPAAIAAGTLKGLFTTSAGRRLLLASSQLEPNSPAMAKLVVKISDQLPKVTTQAAIQANRK